MTNMTVLSGDRPYTRADLDAMPADGHRYELLAGSIVVTPAPRIAHQSVVTQLVTALAPNLPTQLKLLVAPVDVVLGTDTVLQPDVLVADRRAFTERELSSAPLLVVEVLSPSTRLIDLNLKRDRYARAGVAFYWLVDPAGPSVITLELSGGQYHQTAEVVGDQTWTASVPYEVTLNPQQLLD